ncbi:uncharacterized protein DFL_009715 [Arthrobotrys flagrans]|uniref:Uncharacterized protein n=1 Tax=Arthrobotrys flagrans TaxID=97331 RepID=A0A436ZSL7_ARTFL|nr:hypothetical protein DFL_009715 [Arthrobotrys flagrans]
MLYYAVYSRDARKVEKWLREGADPNSTAYLSEMLMVPGTFLPVDTVPVTTFAALLEEPKIVRTLLSFGTKSSVIPSVPASPYIKHKYSTYSPGTQFAENFWIKSPQTRMPNGVTMWYSTNYERA